MPEAMRDAMPEAMRDAKREKLFWRDECRPYAASVFTSIVLTEDGGLELEYSLAEAKQILADSKTRVPTQKLKKLDSRVT